MQSKQIRKHNKFPYFLLDWLRPCEPNVTLDINRFIKRTKTNVNTSDIYFHLQLFKKNVNNVIHQSKDIRKGKKVVGLDVGLRF